MQNEHMEEEQIERLSNVKEAADEKTTSEEPFEIPTDTNKYDIWTTEHGTHWRLKV